MVDNGAPIAGASVAVKTEFENEWLFLRPLVSSSAAKARLRAALSRSETHDPVHGSFINLLKLPNEGALICLVPASNHFMF